MTPLYCPMNTPRWLLWLSYRPGPDTMDASVAAQRIELLVGQKLEDEDCPKLVSKGCSHANLRG